MSSERAPTRAMVTGANGFVGHHVVAELVSRGWGVVAVSRQDEVDAEIADLVESYLPCDLVSIEETRALPLASVDVVINLAGLAAVGESFSQGEEYLRVNCGVLDTVCTVALEEGLSLRVIAVSSGAVYAGGQEMPLRESATLDPASSPYAASKIAMEGRARHFRAAGVDCVVARPFNHIGPGQLPGFLVPDLTAQIQEARLSGAPMRMGNLSTRRDYTDVRDVAAAYVALAAAASCEYDTYNICTGRSLAGTEILAGLLAQLGLDDLPVEPDPAKSRPSDQPDIFGDNGRLATELGWRPMISIEESLRDFLAALTEVDR